MGHKKILIKESALNYLEAMTKEKRKMRIQCTNKIKRMYQCSVFRGKVNRFFKRIAIFKGQLCGLVAQVRMDIMNRNCTKVQIACRKYILEKRLQKIKEQGTKSVTKIAAFFKMKRERRKFLASKSKVIKLQSKVRFFINMASYVKERNCREVANYIFECGWMKVQHRQAIMIQKTWKGYTVRRTFKKVMEEIRKKLKLIKYRDHLMQAIFQHKFQKYLKLLNRYKNPIIKIQALARGKLVRRSYLTVKKAAIFIQKSFRRHLRKKYYLIRLWREYRKHIYT